MTSFVCLFTFFQGFCIEINFIRAVFPFSSQIPVNYRIINEFFCRLFRRFCRAALRGTPSLPKHKRNNYFYQFLRRASAIDDTPRK